MTWKLCEMKMVCWDRIWPLMWVKALMYPRECSTESSEFFDYGEWCPHVEDFPRSSLFQGWFASLNNHGFMGGISIPHLCNNVDARDSYIVAHLTL